MTDGSLRPPITSVVVPQHLSVTAVANAVEGCALQLILRSERSNQCAKLPTTPAGVFGTFVHESLELAAAGDESAVTEFDLRLMSALEEFSATDDFAQLDVSGFVELGTRLRAASIVADALADADVGGISASRDRSGTRRRGTEVFMSSDRLRLKGTADKVKVTADGAVEILDYKTGSVFDAEGSLKVSYVRQLVAYATILEETEPGSTFRGTVHNGDSFAVDVDKPARVDFRRWLRGLIKTIPDAGTGSPFLASPGPDCSFCSYRIGCGAYLHKAHAWWAAPPDFRIPADVWGVVRASTLALDGRLTIEVRDAAGRDVRLLDIGRRHSLPRDLEGRQIWAFGLKPLRFQRRRDGQWLHPRVFRDLASDAGAKPAWECVVFAADG